MNRKDYIIITFFVLIFAIVLYQKKFSEKNSGSVSGSNNNSSSETNSSSGSGAKSGSGGSPSESQRGSAKGSPFGKTKMDQEKMINDIVEKAFQNFEASMALTGDTTLSELLDEENDPNKEIKPPAGVGRSSYYDENGKFKSGYTGTEPPEEFLTKKEFFTDQRKMQQDIEFKMMKAYMDMDSERREFQRTHDEFGKDMAAYQELKKNHQRMRKIISNKNADTLREFRAEINQMDSELR